jgi:hypothetical protein
MMPEKFGIYQASSKSCVFYKQDEDGNQSTFNIFVKESKEKKDLIAFIDNEQMKKENWAFEKDSDMKDLIKAFGGWASDAPIVFELEAQKSMSNCLNSVLKKESEE